MAAPATTHEKNSDAEEPLKEWATRIAAAAPPLSDDQFQQIHAVLVGRAARCSLPSQSRPGEPSRKAA